MVFWSVKITNSPRVLLLTGNARRHRYVASVLAASVNLIGIVTEKKRDPVDPTALMSLCEKNIIDQHLKERNLAEEKLLGKCDFPNIERLDLPEGDANSITAFDWVQDRRPEMVLLYGTSIIRPPLLSVYEGRMINMHLGLSPYYRGAGTNFWPLVDGNPACIGATIHLAVEKVDAGSVLAQSRPFPERFDRAHELGTKAIMAGVQAMISAIELYSKADLSPVSQDLSLGTVYKRSNFSAAAVERMWANLDNGLIDSYVDNYEAEVSKWPIRELRARNGR